MFRLQPEIVAFEDIRVARNPWRWFGRHTLAKGERVTKKEDVHEVSDEVFADNGFSESVKHNVAINKLKKDDDQSRLTEVEWMGMVAEFGLKLRRKGY